MEIEEVNDEGAPVVNIGSLISEKVSESVQNMDVMGMIRKMLDATVKDGGDDESDAVRERLQGILQTYESLSEEEQNTMQKQMKELLTSKLADKFKDYTIDTSGLQEAIGDAIFRMKCYAAAAVVVVILFVFFGYKLYKSIKEKERKREEKKKAKMSKKKK